MPAGGHGPSRQGPHGPAASSTRSRSVPPARPAPPRPPQQRGPDPVPAEHPRSPRPDRSRTRPEPPAAPAGRDHTARDHTARDHTARDHTARDHTAQDHSSPTTSARDRSAPTRRARDHSATTRQARERPTPAPERRSATPVRPTRRRRADKRSGVAWWQTPDSRRRTGGGGLSTGAPTATGVQEPVRPVRTGPLGPLDLLQRRLGAGRRARALLTPAQRAARRRRTVLCWVGGVLGMVVGLPLLALGLGYLIFGVPTADEAVNNQVATISFADGTDLTRLVPEAGNRTKVGFEQIPPHVREAVLAAEDRTFYTNPGFDVSGIARAAWNQLQGGAGGGSTITQQYVKNALVGDQVSLWRKYKELIVSLKVSQEKSKDEILTDYLNTIYFGRGAYGIQSAAQAYFAKDVGQLTPAEGALLAGVIQSPSRWDPAIDPQKAVQRWGFVMDGMESQGWLSPADRAAATFPPTQQRRVGGTGSLADSRGHVVNAVKAELDSLGISDQEMSQAGLTITTTIDADQQKRAVEAAQESLDGQPDNLRSALVAIDPRTGGVAAYYGGDNGVGLDYARVSKQPGSTFKPFVVLAALMHDPPIGLGTVFDGREQTGLRNAEGADCPRCDIKQAMTLSNNVVFTKLAAEVGPENVAAAARAAGITSPLDNPDARLALGNKEVTPVELASAYATIAAGGVWHAPHFISKVVTADGRVLYESPDSQGERRFSPRVARNTVEAMLGVASADERGIGRPVAAKTGTVQSRFEGENNDAWFSGFTPELATTVWIGTDMNSPIRTASGTPIEGASLPGEVWQTFMREAVAEEPATEGFGGYTPIGTPASDLPPNETPTPTPTTTPEPTPSAELPPPPAAEPPAANPVPQQQSGAPDQRSLLAPEDAPGTANAPGTARAPGTAGTPNGPAAEQAPPAGTAPAPDCSVTPCG
ncbi:transglycosylase domain-containing protein [Pseudonocardia xishanensis]|uniref:Penicillin-insensitive transglycosylase n=1 Tax=Pseudonocardia xishanensis TaxID=630995 RepID=A0ABP8RZJ9_9PSEU